MITLIGLTTWTLRRRKKERRIQSIFHHRRSMCTNKSNKQSTCDACVYTVHCTQAVLHTDIFVQPSSETCTLYNIHWRVWMPRCLWCWKAWRENYTEGRDYIVITLNKFHIKLNTMAGKWQAYYLQLWICNCIAQKHRMYDTIGCNQNGKWEFYSKWIGITTILVIDK